MDTVHPRNDCISVFTNTQCACSSLSAPFATPKIPITSRRLLNEHRKRDPSSHRLQDNNAEWETLHSTYDVLRMVFASSVLHLLLCFQSPRPAMLHWNETLCVTMLQILFERYLISGLGAYPGSETQYPSNHVSNHCLKHFEANPISPHVYNPHRAFT
jgi:hypothetical protein